METITDKVEEITENVASIVDTYYQLTSLNIADKLVNVLSTIVVSLGLIAVIIFALLFSGIGLSIYLNHLLTSSFNGYFIVTGIYVLIGIVLWLLRKEIIFPFVRNIFIRKVYE